VSTVLPPSQVDPAVPPHAIDALLAARDEAFRNVERHAGTDRARLELRLPAAGVVELDVIDDGRGFRPDDVPDGVNLGLRLSIAARMRRAGGNARVVSVPGQGTRVELRWPAP
jgi:signal transduction histidine kinase